MKTFTNDEDFASTLNSLDDTSTTFLKMIDFKLDNVEKMEVYPTGNVKIYCTGRVGLINVNVRSELLMLEEIQSILYNRLKDEDANDRKDVFMLRALELARSSQYDLKLIHETLAFGIHNVDWSHEDFNK